jgi:hypothetical protein
MLTINGPTPLPKGKLRDESLDFTWVGFERKLPRSQPRGDCVVDRSNRAVQTILEWRWTPHHP